MPLDLTKVTAKILPTSNPDVYWRMRPLAAAKELEAAFNHAQKMFESAEKSGVEKDLAAATDASLAVLVEFANDWLCDEKGEAPDPLVTSDMIRESIGVPVLTEHLNVVMEAFKDVGKPRLPPPTKRRPSKRGSSRKATLPRNSR